MRLLTGKKIGQSGSELGLAVVFSFFLHVLVISAAIFLYFVRVPRAHIPLSYQVKLVGLPAAASPEPVQQAAPPSPRTEAPKKEVHKAEAPKSKASGGTKAVSTVKAAPKKGAMPELAGQKSKPAIEQPNPSETPAAKQQQAPAASAGGAKAENIAVATPQQDFKFAWYLVAVRDRIGQNWRPPPDAPDAKARVIFSINRSGWVEGVNLDAEHSMGTFGFKQAAIRAIRSSNPFPPLPEDFAKQSQEFSVDLKAE